MKKETLVEIILGTVGGLIFAVGMCMCLIQEWNTFTAGIVVAAVGAVVLLAILPVRRKAHPQKKEHKQIDVKLIVTWCFGVAGALLMGFGMSKLMVEEHTAADMIIGMITGIIGLLACVLNYPIYSYVKNKSSEG